MRDIFSSRRATVLLVLGLSSAVSLGFWGVGAIVNHSLAYWYLIWNLLLAWLPVAFVGWLIVVLKTKPWLSWQAIALTVLWLGFLPNSFYLATDFIHLQDYVRVDVLYDIIMFEAFVINGLLLGYLSLYLVHVSLLRRLSARATTSLIGLTLLICSFAIYLGRDLRLSTWDLLINPARILFSISDPIVSPNTHSQAFTLTLSVFIFLGSFYFVTWQLISIFYHWRKA